MIVFFLIGLLILSACSHPPTADPVLDGYAYPAISRMEAHGEEIYAALCVYCHGESGDGFGINASNLPVAMPDFTSKTSDRELPKDLIQFLQSPRAPESYCPPWDRRLTWVEMQSLAAFIASLQNKQPIPRSP